MNVDEDNLARALADPGLVARVYELKEQIHNRNGGSCLILPGVFAVPDDDEVSVALWKSIYCQFMNIMSNTDSAKSEHYQSQQLRKPWLQPKKYSEWVPMKASLNYSNFNHRSTSLCHQY
jgi:hypothetical protein